MELDIQFAEIIKVVYSIFLGAGTIIFKNRKESVEGLTGVSHHSILFASAIGIAVALNQFAMAVVLTIVVILILMALGYLEGWISKLRKSRYIKRKNNYKHAKG